MIKLTEITVTEIKATEFWLALSLSRAFRLGFWLFWLFFVFFYFFVELTSTGRYQRNKNTFFQHSQGQAFLKPAKLAPDPVILVNLARHVFYARIMQLFLNGPFEEAFASLTTLHSIMKSRWAIPTYGTYALVTVTFLHVWLYKQTWENLKEGNCDQFNQYLRLSFKIQYPKLRLKAYDKAFT